MAQRMNIKGGPLVDTGPGIGTAILGVNWSFTGLAIIVVTTRIWLRRSSGYALHDWLMVLATIFTILYASFLSTAVYWGLGRKYESIMLHEFKNSQYWNLMAQFFGNLQPVISRWSIAVFLNHIMGKTKPFFRAFLYVWVLLMAIVGILSNIFTFLDLDPIQANWDPTIKGTHRFNPIATYYTVEAGIWQCAISDLLFGIVPIITIWRLQMPTHRKIGLSLLLSGTFIVFFASLAKIIFSTMQIRGELKNLDGPSTGIVWICAGIDQGLVIVLGSLPLLRPLAHMQFATDLYGSLVYLITLGRRSRRSSEANSGNEGNAELNFPRGFSDSERGSTKGSTKESVPEYVTKKSTSNANGTLATLDDERNIRMK